MHPKYESICIAVESAGFFTGDQPMEDGEERIICAGRRTANSQGLTGNSFWILERQGQWYLGVWSGFVYQFQGNHEVALLCVEWLQNQPDGTPCHLDEGLMRKYGLTEVTDAFDH